VIGIDTNILLRWLVYPEEWDIGSSKSEIETVEKTILSKGAEFFVNSIVVAETAWILEQKLKLGRADICEVINRLLYSVNIRVGDGTAVNDARQIYEASNIGFADCLISCLNRGAGCPYTLTFDRKASRQDGFRNIHAKD
jgi:predicted nucleic-acid-binding protein